MSPYCGTEQGCLYSHHLWSSSHGRAHDIMLHCRYCSPLSIPVSLSPMMSGNPIKIINGFNQLMGIDVTDDVHVQMIVSEYSGHSILILNSKGKKINSLVPDGNGSLILPHGLAVTPNGTILV